MAQLASRRSSRIAREGDQEAMRLPVSYERAMTAIVQGRQRVERAREDVGLAMEILCRMAEEDCGGQTPSMPLLVSLEEVLGKLDDSARALREVGRSR
jgi:hypothetical protein